MNRFSLKQSLLKNNNNNNNINSDTNIVHINPFRVKRTYNTMLEQNHCMPTTINFASKRLKQNDSNPPELLIKNNKPKIPEKILKEIERYNYQRYAYSMKITQCPCEDK